MAASAKRPFLFTPYGISVAIIVACGLAAALVVNASRPQLAAPVTRTATVVLITASLAGLVTVIGRRTETIRRQVEERTSELAESRRQYANLLHALPGMAYRGTYDGRLVVTFASEGTLALTGWTADEFVGGARQLPDIVHPDDLERMNAAIRAALDARRDFEVEHRIRSRRGEEKWVLSRGRGVYAPDGGLLLVEGLIIDISFGKRAESERLAIERKLLESQKLESLGLLAGGIAHDFNNLLTGILGNASLARLSLDPGNPLDAQMRAIETASLRAAELCRQMLAYAGKGQFVVERLDVSAVIEEMLPLLRVSITPSAQLHLQLEHGLPRIKADATQIRQILMNLVLNAVDALTERERDITIRTGVAEVDRALLASCVTGTTLPVGTYVWVDVTDTGCGMAPDVLTRIFDPFFTTKFAGRGLGLAAVLGIVRSHNGALLVESEVGRGSTFRLFLPPALPEPAAPVRPPTSHPWAHDGHALVIDDEEAVRNVVVGLLKRYGLQGRAVPDGHAGLAAFRERPQDWALVVLDYLMPGLSGEETLRAIRAIRPDTPVLLISGFAEGEILSRLDATAGPVVFLSKPFKPELLRDKLRQLLG